MRIPCPICGERDLREFYYQGAASMIDRPAANADIETFADYLHNRDNPAGATQELWHHEYGCSAWLIVERDTNTHAISGARLAKGDE